MIIQYRLDPKNPPRLTPEQQERLKKARIDYSDIPPLDDEFFSKEATRRRAQGATLQELADSYDRSISTMRRATRAA